MFKNGLTPVLFNINFAEKNVYFSGNQTRIVWVLGEHADHLTTITAHISTKINSTNINFILTKLLWRLWEQETKCFLLAAVSLS